MEQTGTVKLAKVLKVLVTITFICNLAMLPLVPGFVYIGGFESAARLAGYQISELWGNLIDGFFFAWKSDYTAVLAAFLLFCGICTAVTLWQARGVLGTIIERNTFTLQNARRMRVAAWCMFLICGAALCRTLWGFFFYKSIQPLFTYNALFIPVFAMAGLLCMVMSALFRQAA